MFTSDKGHIKGASDAILKGALDAIFGNSNNINAGNDYAEQARAVLDPEFERQMKTTMANLDRNSINRGFYGQLPQDVFKRSTAGDLTSMHNANIARYAQQLMHDDRMYDIQKEQLKNQKEDSGGGFLGFLGNIAGGLLGGLF